MLVAKMTPEEAVQCIDVRFGAITEIILNRPEKRNAMTRAMDARLVQLLDECADRSDVKAVLVWGKGPSFCAGHDLHEYAELRDNIPPHQMDEGFNRESWVQALWKFPKPLLCVAHGFVGLIALRSVIAYADLVVAVSGTNFSLEHLKVGGVPGAANMLHLIGPRRAKEWAMLGSPMSAERLYEWGGVNAVLPTLEEAMELARAWAEQLASIEPVRLGGTKAAINSGYDTLVRTHSNVARHTGVIGRLAGEIPDQYFGMVRKEGLRAALAWRDQIGSEQ